MTTVNYSMAQTAEMVAAYVAADSDKTRAGVVADFAFNLGKTAASVRAKLVREGVYVAKTYATKAGEKAVSKEALVQAIAALVGVSSDMLVGLEKANKTTLSRVYSKIATDRETIAALEDEMRGEAQD